jgi:hypothetical protein
MIDSTEETGHQLAEKREGSPMAKGTTIVCDHCPVEMTPQSEKLDLGWVCDGACARDDDFRGILAEVYSCSRCGHVAIRPVTIELTRHRANAA